MLGYLRKKDFKSIRKWVAANQPDSTMLYRYLYDNASKYLAANQIAQLIIILGEYQYKQAFVADSEINIVACLTEIMLSCEFR